MTQTGEEEEALIICVTGGSGGVGSTVCRLLGDGLLEKRVLEVRVADLRKPRGGNFAKWEDDLEGVKPRLNFVKTSVTEPKELDVAFEGCHVVVHCAGLIDFGGQLPLRKVMEVNVEGTRNVIAACRRNNVRTLVYTSSLDSVTSNGPCVNIKNDEPYPVELKDFSSKTYGLSKSIAERFCLIANRTLCDDDKTVMHTCALRFRSVYGEYDNVYLTRIIAARKNGLLLFKIGEGKNRWDHCYNGNVAYGHLCAINTLESGDKERIAKVGGRPFSLAHGKQQSLYEFARPYLQSFKADVPEAFVPAWIMKIIAYVVTAILSLIPERIRPNNTLTPYVIDAVTSEQTFQDLEGLKDLGYKPLYSEDEIFLRTKRWLHEEWEDRPGGPKEESARLNSNIRMKSIVITIIAAFIVRTIAFWKLGY